MKSSSHSKKQVREKSKGAFIVKIIFCIIVFNIVVRSPLWISMGLFVPVGLYLLKSKLLMILTGKGQPHVLEKILCNIKLLNKHKQPVQPHSQVRFIIDEQSLPECDHHFTDSLSVPEDHFEDIWRHHHDENIH